jgi:hypothetical protein
MDLSDDLGVPHQESNNFIQICDALEDIVLEHGGELMLDRGEQGDDVQ